MSDRRPNKSKDASRAPSTIDRLNPMAALIASVAAVEKTKDAFETLAADFEAANPSSVPRTVATRSPAGGIDPSDLRRAREGEGKLEAATEKMNRTLQRAEKVFAALRLGVSASVQMDHEDTSIGEWIQVLKFAKDSNEWRLIMASGYGDDSWTETPLLSASRADRLKALGLLPDLLQNLLVEAHKQARGIESQIDTAESFLNEVETAAGARTP